MFQYLLPFGSFCGWGLLFLPSGKPTGAVTAEKEKARRSGLSLCLCIAATLRAYRQEL